VAETAIDPQPANMMLMTERYWLLHDPTRMQPIVGARPKPPPGDSGSRQYRDAEHGEPDNKVRTWLEDGGHLG